MRIRINAKSINANDKPECAVGDIIAVGDGWVDVNITDERVLQNIANGSLNDMSSMVQYAQKSKLDTSVKEVDAFPLWFFECPNCHDMNTEGYYEDMFKRDSSDKCYANVECEFCSTNFVIVRD